MSRQFVDDFAELAEPGRESALAGAVAAETQTFRVVIAKNDLLTTRLLRTLLDTLGFEIVNEAAGDSAVAVLHADPFYRASPAGPLREIVDDAVRSETSGVVPFLRILVVEDAVTNQSDVRSVLEKAGHAVTLVENARLAAAALEHWRFDLVLLDMEISDASGSETVTAIRQSEHRRGELPIVALTVDAVSGERLKSGGVDYIVRPIVPATLHEKVRALTAGHREVPARLPRSIQAWRSRTKPTL